MVAITTRAGKGSPLTNAEMDANLEGLNQYKEETLEMVEVTAEQTLDVGRHYTLNLGYEGAFDLVVDPPVNSRLKISIKDGILRHSLVSSTSTVTIGNYNPYVDGPLVLDVIFFTYTLVYLGGGAWSISV